MIDTTNNQQPKENNDMSTENEANGTREDGGDCLKRLVSEDAWSHEGGKMEDRSAKEIAFLVEVIQVCKKHGYSISHEESNGAFEIEKWSEGNAEWLGAANNNLR